MISDLHKVIDNLKSINGFEKQIMKVMDLEKLDNYLANKVYSNFDSYETPEYSFFNNPIYIELDRLEKLIGYELDIIKGYANCELSYPNFTEQDIYEDTEKWWCSFER